MRTTVGQENVESMFSDSRSRSHALGISAEYGQRYLHHYTRRLKEGGKYDLTIWPYHAMLGGIGHALVSCIEEAIFFHTMARQSQPDFQVKGRNPLTENYSVLRPEVSRTMKQKRSPARMNGS
jgi:nicotinamidase-related amidase